MTTKLSTPGSTSSDALPMRGKSQPAAGSRSTPALSDFRPSGTPGMVKRPLPSVRTMVVPPATSAFVTGRPVLVSTRPKTVARPLSESVRKFCPASWICTPVRVA